MPWRAHSTTKSALGDSIAGIAAECFLIQRYKYPLSDCSVEQRQNVRDKGFSFSRRWDQSNHETGGAGAASGNSERSSLTLPYFLCLT
jgi:hypothetical protein